MSDSTLVADEDELPELFLPDGVTMPQDETPSDEPLPEPEDEPEAPEADADPEPEAEEPEQSDSEDEFWRVQYKHNREEKVLDLREKLKDPEERKSFIERWQKAEDYDRVRQQRDAERAAAQEALQAQRDDLVRRGLLKYDQTTGQYSYAQIEAAPKADPVKDRLAELEGKLAAYEEKGEAPTLAEWREFQSLSAKHVLSEANAQTQRMLQEQQQQQQTQQIQKQITGRLESALEANKDAFDLAGEQADFFREQARQTALTAAQQAGNRATMKTFDDAIAQYATALRKAATAAQVKAAKAAKPASRKKAPPVVTGGRPPAGRAEHTYKTEKERDAAIEAYLAEQLG